jgi:hypothetical protein
LDFFINYENKYYIQDLDDNQLGMVANLTDNQWKGMSSISAYPMPVISSLNLIATNWSVGC